MDQDGLQIDSSQSVLPVLNENVLWREDFSFIPRDAFQTDQCLYRIVYGIKASHSEQLGLNTESALFFPAQPCVKAYFIRSAQEKRPLQEHLSFALDYIRANALHVNGDALLSLPFYSTSPDTGICQYALIPVKTDMLPMATFLKLSQPGCPVPEAGTARMD